MQMSRFGLPLLILLNLFHTKQPVRQGENKHLDCLRLHDGVCSAIVGKNAFNIWLWGVITQDKYYYRFQSKH